MEWFIAVVVIAALGVAAVAASGGLGQMSDEPVRDVFRQDLVTDRPLDAADLNRLRFGVALRGYAMDQVDHVLDRLAVEIAERDAVIGELRAQVAALGPEPADEAAAPVDEPEPVGRSEHP